MTTHRMEHSKTMMRLLVLALLGGLYSCSVDGEPGADADPKEVAAKILEDPDLKRAFIEALKDELKLDPDIKGDRGEPGISPLADEVAQALVDQHLETVRGPQGQDGGDSLVLNETGESQFDGTIRANGFVTQSRTIEFSSDLNEVIGIIGTGQAAKIFARYTATGIVLIREYTVMHDGFPPVPDDLNRTNVLNNGTLHEFDQFGRGGGFSISMNNGEIIINATIGENSEAAITINTMVIGIPL